MRRQNTWLDRILADRHLERSDLASVLGVTTTAVNFWANRVRIMRPEYAMTAERLLGIPKGLLRPDLWPPEPTPLSAGGGLVSKRSPPQQHATG
jgi:DNA-binding transcriptional regulator YdaS (Cro superfamily)